MKPLKFKVPKRIAGVKVPKSVRKGPVVDFLKSSGGQVLMAEALLLAARSYSAKHVNPQSATAELIAHPVDALKDAAGGAKRRVKQRTRVAASADLSFAFGEAVKAFRAALNGADHDVYADRDDNRAGLDQQKKKKWPPERTSQAH